MAKKRLYIDNIPRFEEYDLIDLNQDDAEFLIKVNEDKEKIYRGVRVPDNMYIIGKNQLEYIEYLDVADFKKDYLKLGKDLFNLCISKNNIEFDNSYKLDDKDIYLKYICSDYDYQFEAHKKYKEDFDNIYDFKNEVEIFFYNTVYEERVVIFIDTLDRIVNILISIYAAKNINIKKYLDRIDKEVLSRMSKCITMLEKENSKLISSEIDKINVELQNILIELESVGTNEVNIRRKISTSSRKNIDEITNIDFKNKVNECPIKIKFTYNQFKDLKRIIKKWLKKYGFPYYVSTDDEDDYIQKIHERLDLKDNENAVPCDILINNSIYSYILYDVLVNKNKSNEVIRKLFDLKNNKKINNKNFFSLRDDYLYYTNINSAKLFDYKSSYTDDDVADKKDLREDNDFAHKGDDGWYKDRIFNNLCIAFNIKLKNDTLYETPNSKDRQCPICKKWFTVNKKYRTYCSNKCKEKGKREKEKEYKRKQRKK